MFLTEKLKLNVMLARWAGIMGCLGCVTGVQGYSCPDLCPHPHRAARAPATESNADNTFCEGFSSLLGASGVAMQLLGGFGCCYAVGVAMQLLGGSGCCYAVARGFWVLLCSC